MAEQFYFCGAECAEWVKRKLEGEGNGVTVPDLRKMLRHLKRKGLSARVSGRKTDLILRLSDLALDHYRLVRNAIDEVVGDKGGDAVVITKTMPRPDLPSVQFSLPPSTMFLLNIVEPSWMDEVLSDTRTSMTVTSPCALQQMQEASGGKVQIALFLHGIDKGKSKFKYPVNYLLVIENEKNIVRIPINYPVLQLTTLWDFDSHNTLRFEANGVSNTNYGYFLKNQGMTIMACCSSEDAGSFIGCLPAASTAVGDVSGDSDGLVVDGGMVSLRDPYTLTLMEEPGACVHCNGVFCLEKFFKNNKARKCPHCTKPLGFPDVKRRMDLLPMCQANRLRESPCDKVWCASNGSWNFIE